ncbi:unnamed protein product [Moneuplotes crassus]|uniref:Cryptochrome/DNA photolyase FAD-binding domain-containing protein n=1 Tax=Euplotes crassus TaxID=5936 RepID=A0AAD2DAT9_EUPCR|nr:unnamed protein product [Moneuplotes crassus]
MGKSEEGSGKEGMEELGGKVPMIEECGFRKEEMELLSTLKPSIKAGEEAGLHQLRTVLDTKTSFDHYNDQKDELQQKKAGPASLTQWVVNGCLSVRRVYEEVGRLESKQAEEIEQFRSDLLLRDFLYFRALKYQSKYFNAEYGIYDRSNDKWETDPIIIEKIKGAKSGMPMIDALVRCLKTTGYISLRGRMIFAHYFSQDLKQDWRIGAKFFQKYQLDFEPCSIYGEWHASAGIGPGKIYKFHVLNQGQAFDPDGSFIKSYLPELEKVPIEFIHDPYRMPKELQQKCGVIIGETYPRCIECERYTQKDRRYPTERTLESQKKIFEKVIKPGYFVKTTQQTSRRVKLPKID